jgi:predicted RecB family nuclease
MGDIAVITSEVFVAYSQCPRKAFMLLFSEDKGEPHDYPLILEERRDQNRTRYREKFLQSHPDAKQYEAKDFKKHEFLLNATLKSGQLEAYCVALTKVNSNDPENRRNSYEPTIVTGTYSITPEQKTELLFVSLVLERIQKKLPTVGRIVTMDEKVHRVKLDKGYRGVKAYLKTLEPWCSTQPSEAPALILNKYCPSCQFRDICREQAEKENNLSLLDRMTAKAIQKYNKRGIFTVQQLSYLFKPRRKRKKRKNPEPIKHSLELQALAIREKKIYIQEMPELIRQPVELFLDIEGIPDQHFYYLIGLLVCAGPKPVQHSFWANTLEDEGMIWNQLLSKLNEYPEAPIYHYGSYELRALNELTKRYSNDTQEIEKRLVNINSAIFGKIHFPAFSNGLKEIGTYIGAIWTSEQASGLQSLVWRYKWEESKGQNLSETLIDYNREDCQALNLLVDKISEVKQLAKHKNDIEFADQPKKLATEMGELIHHQLESILKSAHSNYNKTKVTLRIRGKEKSEAKSKKLGPKYNHPGYHRILPKPDRSVYVPMRSKCPECQSFLCESEKLREKIIIDLKVTKRGLQKKIIRYLGAKGYCEQCDKFFNPSFIDELGSQLFGHSFQSWIVNQRLALRLPLNIIQKEIQELFSETISQGTLVNYIKNFADFYSDSEEIIFKNILASPFIHADETPISIRGINQYAWTFTDGSHVIFKLTDSRESDIVHKTLQGYNGVLVSDFYGGYDSLPCKQQKCWVHLLRDINDDLWRSPFDIEYEGFVLKIQKFILPIFEAIDKYGLKKRHLRKFAKDVDQFYKNNIQDKSYHSELAIKYQKRFERYRESLFTFLEYDSMPWHNNTAERALRHIAVQEKISGAFFESGFTAYLTLLGIMQTCRFQEKSFLKFLVSGEKDVNAFKAPKARRN